MIRMIIEIVVKRRRMSRRKNNIKTSRPSTKNKDRNGKKCGNG